MGIVLRFGRLGCKDVMSVMNLRLDLMINLLNRRSHMNASCNSVWLNHFLRERGGVMTISMRLTTHG